MLDYCDNNIVQRMKQFRKNVDTLWQPENITFQDWETSTLQINQVLNKLLEYEAIKHYKVVLAQLAQWQSLGSHNENDENGNRGIVSVDSSLEQYEMGKYVNSPNSKVAELYENMPQNVFLVVARAGLTMQQLTAQRQTRKTLQILCSDMIAKPTPRIEGDAEATAIKWLNMVVKVNNDEIVDYGIDWPHIRVILRMTVAQDKNVTWIDNEDNGGLNVAQMYCNLL